MGKGPGAVCTPQYRKSPAAFSSVRLSVCVCVLRLGTLPAQNIWGGPTTQKGFALGF